MARVTAIKGAARARALLLMGVASAITACSEGGEHGSAAASEEASVSQSSAAQPQASASAAPAEWGRALLERSEDWYRSEEARTIADNVMRYQSEIGGWPKNVDLAVWPPRPEDADFATDGKGNTFDNDATSTPMEFLARAYAATGEEAYRDAFMRGFEYMLEAQYDNGGWPQFYPLRDGYFSRITFNDDAMIRVMTLLRDVAQGAYPYQFVGEADRRRAAEAVERGIDVILKTQLKQGGELAGWCAQYDENTFEPAWARAYEPPSLSGMETVGIIRYLMDIENPSPDVVKAIEGGVRWLRESAITGYRFERFRDESGSEDRRVVEDDAAPPLWARFYELETNRPIFLGRDSVTRYALNEIEQERRSGYNYYGQWPAELLEKDYPAWKARVAKAEIPKGAQ